MQDLSIFKFEAQEVRTVIRDGEPWFVAKDVAEALGYSNPARSIQDHCKHAERVSGSELSANTDLVVASNHAVSNDISHNDAVRAYLIIPERDLYRLVIRSNLPAAEAFEDWVVGQVLPSIRKTGAYHADKWYAAIDVYNAGKKATGKAPQGAMRKDFSQTLVWSREQPGMSDAIKGNNGEYFIREDMVATVLFACSSVTERGQLTGKGGHVLEVVRRNAWITGEKADHLVETSVEGVFRGPNTLHLEA